MRVEGDVKVIQHPGCPASPPDDPVNPDSLSIDDFGPMPVRRPASVADVCGLVKEAAGAGQAIYTVGGRTSLDVGLPPIKPGFALDTTALNEVIDYPARDMTITVRAGITIAKLQEILAAEHQWLPVDVANPERATLGGAVALNQSGPRRFGWGTLRDYVIGISFVTDEGVEVKAGGRVVKNVAGYDLMKLQVGAVGTLGVITQLTLKVKPKPELFAALAFGCSTDDLHDTLDRLHASKSRPHVVEVLNAAAWRAVGVSPLLTSDFVAAIGFEEKTTTVEWQVQTLLDELKNVRDVARITDPVSLWAAITALQSRPDSRFIWKAMVLPSQLANVVHTVPLNLPYLVHAEALNGIAWFHVPSELDLDLAKLCEMEQRLTAGGGNYVMRRCPADKKGQLRIWGRETDAWNLMRHVKQTLDPKDVFNPGRLFGDR
jgi:glycolate oxidase FAD binding subunit